jgi:hypothetical protein
MKALILMLKSLHLKTVENVAEMSDQTISTIGMGGRELRTRAQKFLEVQKKVSTADELAAKDDVIRSFRNAWQSPEKKKQTDDEEERG